MNTKTIIAFLFGTAAAQVLMMSIDNSQENYRLLQEQYYAEQNSHAETIQNYIELQSHILEQKRFYSDSTHQTNFAVKHLQ
jgi:hypothetical protein